MNICTVICFNELLNKLKDNSVFKKLIGIPGYKQDSVNLKIKVGVIGPWLRDRQIWPEWDVDKFPSYLSIYLVILLSCNRRNFSWIGRLICD